VVGIHLAPENPEKVGGVNRPPLRSSNVRETFCQRGNTHVYRRVVSEKCGPRQYHGCIPAAFRAWVFSFGERVQSTSGSNVRFSRLWSLALRDDRNGSTYVEDGVWMKGQGLGYHGCTPSSIPMSRLKSPSSTCEQTLGQDVGQTVGLLVSGPPLWQAIVEMDMDI
jgi:hypothetical protein